MKPLVLLSAIVGLGLLLPSSASAQSGSSRNTVYVEVNTSRGPAQIPLTRKGDGFVGPRGEYYPSFPTKQTLAAVYGSAPATKSTPKPAATSGGTVSGDLSAKAVSGGVRVSRNGKFYREVRTKYPDVRGWKFARENSAIVVKSGVGREPGYVEMFDLKTGKRLEKIKATDVRNGKPSWAKHFAE